MRQYLPKVAHIDQRPADRAIAEMIGFGLRDRIGVNAGVARDFGRSSRSPFVLRTKRIPLTIDHLAVLCDQHIDAGAAFSIG
jgi:hypothetical protein